MTAYFGQAVYGAPTKYGDDFITDRTAADVASAAETAAAIRTNGFAALSDTARLAWLRGLKGCYNVRDMRRVASAVKSLAPDIPVRTDWRRDEVPGAADLDEYLAAVRGVQAMYNYYPGMSSLNVYGGATYGAATYRAQSLGVLAPPASMANLDYDGANRIELILQGIYDQEYGGNNGT